MPVPAMSLVSLFVADPLKSAKFYSQILGVEPVEEAPTFVLFALHGVMLGLWSPKTAQPTVDAKPGSSEISFEEEDVDSVYERWLKLGVPIAQKPTDMNFGRTFLALDPDGHRIRVYRLHEENK